MEAIRKRSTFMAMNSLLQSFLHYIEYEKRYSKHTIEAYQTDLQQLGAYLKKEYEKDEPATATHTEIRSWIVQMMEAKISARSINRKISSLKSFYKFAIRKGVIKKSPLGKVQNPKTSKRLPVFVEEPGIDRLLKQIEFPEGYEGARDKIIIELFYGTGIRRNELINLRETDIDSYNAQIKVLGKGNKERIIPIHPELRTSLKNFMEVKKKLVPSQQEDFLVVDENGKKIPAYRTYEIVRKYLNLITTVDKRSPHVLRHTFATHLMNHGADINAVKELLGHSSLAATQVYTHNTIEKLKNIYKQAHPKA